MDREPKVACIEINCPRAGWSKDSTVCHLCKPRWAFLAAIEAGNVVRTHYDGTEEHRVATAKRVLEELFV